MPVILTKPTRYRRTRASVRKSDFGLRPGSAICEAVRGCGGSVLPAMIIGSLMTLICAVAHAEGQSRAERLFRDGRELMKAGDYEGARVKLYESHEQDATLGTLLNLAICDEHLGRTATAWKEYREVLDSMSAADPRAPLVRHGLDALGPSIPRVRFATTPEASGVLVELDGEPLRVTSRIDVLVDPGVHHLFLLAPGGHRSARHIHIEPGEVVVVDPSLWAPEPESSHPAPQTPASASAARQTPSPFRVVSTRGNSLRMAAYVAGGVGAAGFIAAGVLSAVAMEEKPNVNAHCGGYRCDAVGIRAVDSGARLLRLADVGLALGVAGVVSGGVLFWQSSRQGLRVTPTVGGGAIMYQALLP